MGLQINRASSTYLAAQNQTYTIGRFIIETDTKKVKLTDGVTAWNGLPYFPISAADVRDLLAALTGDNRLDASAIKNLPSGGGGGTAVDEWQVIFTALGSTIKDLPPGVNPSNAATALALGDGAVRFQPVIVKTAGSRTGMKIIIRAAGSYTADNNNKVGLYTYSAGTLTLVAQSADNGTLWSASGNNAIIAPAFTTPYTVTPGLYFTGLLYNNSAQTTAPTLGGSASLGSVANGTMDFSDSAKLCATLSGQTDLPSSVAMSALSIQSNGIVLTGLY